MVAQHSTTKNQHTAGPWIVRPDVLDRDSFDVLAPNEDRGKQGVSYSGEYLMIAHGLDSEADARLIAAAPDLLWIVKRFLQHQDIGTRVSSLDTLCGDARAILRDVEGT